MQCNQGSLTIQEFVVNTCATFTVRKEGVEIKNKLITRVCINVSRIQHKIFEINDFTNVKILGLSCTVKLSSRYL